MLSSNRFLLVLLVMVVVVAGTVSSVVDKLLSNRNRVRNEQQELSEIGICTAESGENANERESTKN